MSGLPGTNTTSPSLIDRLGDWQDHDAWVGFVRCYEPALRLYCRRFAFDPNTMEELLQQIWIELARRLKTYSYDPRKTFRGWLMHVCRSRAIDLIRKRNLDAKLALELRNEPVFEHPGALSEREDDRPDFVRMAEGVQAAVRARVDDRTWTTFWWIVVEGRSVRETADAQGLSYAAAFAAQKRVRRMLREEGERCSQRTADDPSKAHAANLEKRA